MFPRWLRDKLVAATLAARITVTAGLAVIVGERTAAFAASDWAAVIFAVTAATASFAFWALSGRLVSPAE